MSQLGVFIAGLLLLAESQASDVADRSTLQGFLPKYMPSGSDASRSSMSAYDNFITPNFNSAKHGKKADALSSHQSPAEHGAITFTVVDDKPLLHPTAQMQANPISLYAIGVGLLSLVTMLGVHLRRRLQPATIIASNGGLANNVMEMKSQDSHKMNSSRVGWGQLSDQNTRPSTLCYALETQEDLKSLAKSLNPVVGYWDPLSIGDDKTTPTNGFWSEYSNERKIAWFRQAEIKHGRVAMAAFVGYCVQANGYHWPFKMTLEGADWPTGTPPEQWDALPQASKWQIILFAGVLELFDEAKQPHYTNGRKPGDYPSFDGTYIRENTAIAPLDLFDPFGFSKKASPEKKARGLNVEINNGRLAMLAVFAFLSESKAPGAVPLLTGKIPAYSGDYMIPFEGNFDLFG